MLLFNEKHQQLDVDTVKAELLDGAGLEIPSQTELETTLGNYYQQALQLEAGKFKFQAAFAPGVALDLGGIGKKILEAIKKFICGVLNNSSTSGEIMDAILDALSSIIPGGIIIKNLAKLLVKYILSIGIGNFCAVPSAN